MQSMLKGALIALCLSMLLTACCEVMTEPDFCTIPTTNNPDITRHSNSTWKPGATY